MRIKLPHDKTEKQISNYHISATNGARNEPTVMASVCINLRVAAASQDCCQMRVRNLWIVCWPLDDPDSMNCNSPHWVTEMDWRGGIILIGRLAREV